MESCKKRMQKGKKLAMTDPSNRRSKERLIEKREKLQASMDEPQGPHIRIPIIFNEENSFHTKDELERESKKGKIRRLIELCENYKENQHPLHVWRGYLYLHKVDMGLGYMGFPWTLD
ncbi:hypothetical protein Tco_0986469 [Tanacetum coccineum]